MPPTPKILEAQRPVGLVEVGRKPKAQQQSDTDGDIAVTAEVSVDLQGIAVDGQQCLQAGGTTRVGEYAVHQLGGQYVGQDHLLEQAAQNEADGPSGVDRRPVVSGQLGQEVPGPHDGSGYQLRKEPHEEREVQEAVGRFQDPPVDVN